MWYYVPSTCAPATEASSWLSDSPEYRPSPWVTSNGTATPRPSSWRGWPRRTWARRLSGLSWSPSLLTPSVARWISSQPGSPVSPSPRRAASEVSMTSDGSGHTLPGSSLTWDRASCSWRTCPSLFEPGFLTSCPTLPETGSMRSGVVSPQPMLAPPTTATASGSSDGATTLSSHSWGTPTARQDSKHPETAAAAKEAMGREALTTLRTQALTWATPTSHDMKGSGLHHTRGGSDLAGQAEVWPTPTVMGNHSQPGSKAGAGLTTLARSWPTPKARDERTHQGQESRHDPDLASVASRHHPTTNEAGEPGSELVDLNPCFVAALMGVPLNWLTPSTSVGTDSFRQWQQQHSSNSAPGRKRSRRAERSQPSLFAIQDES